MVCTVQAKLRLRLTGPTRTNAYPRFIAAEQPPHLKAIAPWEGMADYYRELLCRGGIPNYAFVDYRGSGYCGAIPTHPKSSIPQLTQLLQARTDRKTQAP